MRTSTPPAASSERASPDATTVAPDAPAVSEETSRASRRSFFFFGALAAAAMVPGTASAQRASRKRKVVERAPEPVAPVDESARYNLNTTIAPFADWASNLNRLVRRVTYGETPAEIARATALGFQGYLNYQLNYTRINDDAVENFVLSKWPLMSQTSDTLATADANQVRSQLQESTIYRAAFSQRQLYHRMVEFWSDHFNQDFDKVGYLLVGDQRDVIRAHALGKFPDLLKASAHSASMMIYLDQNASRGTAPNQNYAREIMELHTLGVDGGYTQTDVAELSRVLTGWTVAGRGVFTFNPAIHDWGQKTVLGVTIPAGSPSQGAAGQLEGEKMLDVLVNHPSTARFIATKMLKWLLDPNPSETQISTIASVYRATGGDIKLMIRAILNDAWLPAAPMKLKRPFHYAASSLRALNPTVTSMATINNQLSVLGHQSFTWDTPDGYPDKIEYWAGNIVPRWNYASVASSLNSATTLQVDTTAYRAGSPAAAVDLLDQNFFGGEMPAATRTALLAYAGTTALTDAKARELLGLAICANAYQWY